MRLEEVTDKHDAPYFSLQGQEHEAKCFYVYDCDTIHVAIRLHGTCTSFRCRIRGIDGPEIRSKSVVEKTLAYAGRVRVKELVDKKMVRIRCHHFDKYGRLLVDVLFDNDDLGRTLIQEHLAYPYDGGTKRSDWETLHSCYTKSQLGE